MKYSAPIKMIWLNVLKHRDRLQVWHDVKKKETTGFRTLCTICFWLKVYMYIEERGLDRRVFIKLLIVVISGD